MGATKTRKSPRAQVSLVARYRSPTAFEFVHEECFDLSAGGMFIKSVAPAPSGTLIKLECDVDDGAAKIRGVARVVWLREANDDEHPAGMGVKFVKLDPGGREVINAILERIGPEIDDDGAARRSDVPEGVTPEPFRPTPSSRPSAVGADASTDEGASAGERAKANLASGAQATSSEAITVRPPREVAEERIAASAPPASSAPAPVPAAGAAEAHSPPASQSPQPAPQVAQPRSGEADARAAAAKEPAVAQGARSTKSPSGRARDLRGRLDHAKRATAPAKDRAEASPAIVPAATRSRSGARPVVYGLIALLVGAGAYALSGKRSAPSQAASPPQPAAVAIESAPLQPASQLQVTVAPAEQPEAQRAAVTEARPAAEPPLAQPEPEPEPGYVLEVITRPEGARVRIGERNLIAPAEVQLGTLSEPVEVKAEKNGYDPAGIVVDRVGFMLDEGVMRRRVVLRLHEATAREPRAKPRPKRNKAPEPQPAQVVDGEPAAEATKAPEPARAADDEPKAQAAPSTKQTPMQAAMACLSTGDNACVVEALEGKAKTAQELELLIETFRTLGAPAKSEKYMKVYVDKYPAERRSAGYRRLLERQAAEAAPAPAPAP